jgi:26S proteasome non-ATPase regulatory subunit 10
MGKQPEELFEAAGKGDIHVFKELTEPQLHQALSLKNEDERSLLHVAAAAGHAQVVQLLTDGVDLNSSGINSGDEEGWTPLHSAVSTGSGDVVEVLLRSGADVQIANAGGRTALHYAASKGHADIARLLVSHGANINKKDQTGCTPLHRAASAGHVEVIDYLIEEGADLEAYDKEGQTPLMLATICDNRQAALLLVRHGASVDAEDKEGFTVLGRAPQDLRPTLIETAKAMQGIE